jgi:kinesin family protein C1
MQNEKLRADVAESLLHGTHDALQSQLEEVVDELNAERRRAENAEASLVALRKEALDLQAVGQVHQEVAAEATRRAEASEVMKRKLQEELSTLMPGVPLPQKLLESGTSLTSSVVGPCRKVIEHLSWKTSSDHGSTMCDEDSLSPHHSREVLTNMVAASADEVLHAQIQLGLEKQSNAQLRLRLQAVEDEAEAFVSDKQETEAQMQAMQVALQKATMQRDTYSNALAEMNREVQELRASECLERKKAHELEYESRSLRAQFAQLKASVDLKEKQLAEVKQELAVRSADTKKVEDAKGLLEAQFRTYQEYHGTGDAHQLKAIAQLQYTVDTLTREQERTKNELVSKQNNTEQMRSEIVSLEEQVRVVEHQRRDLHNQVQELKGNIRVFCRVRPVAADTEVSLYMPEPSKLHLAHGAIDEPPYAFAFDKVFGMDSLQAEIYDEVDGLVQSALDGYKVSIFAYGQTGSGKTYTMTGTDQPGCWGLIPRSLGKIFQTSQRMRARGWTWLLQVSILEVYNENIRDLLRGGGDSAAGAGHKIEHHEDWGTIVTNMTCIEVQTMETIETLLARANKQRAMGSTCSNAISSRSHSVFCLYLTGTNKLLGQELYGALHLVDLSGSERLDKSMASGDRLKETQSINRSLSELTGVFAAKAEGRSHIPFRNSKLTYLLEPCLSGQGKTLMVVNVRGEKENSHETLCSLRFARQVNQCNTGGKPKRTLRAVTGDGRRLSIGSSPADAFKTPRSRSRTSSIGRDPGGQVGQGQVHRRVSGGSISGNSSGVGSTTVLTAWEEERASSKQAFSPNAGSRLTQQLTATAQARRCSPNRGANASSPANGGRSMSPRGSHNGAVRMLSK